jgi:hypothetical protein
LILQHEEVHYLAAKKIYEASRKAIGMWDQWDPKKNVVF